MNANELADWIENGAPFGKYETAKQAVVMLRQQQEKINKYELRHTEQRKRIDEQQAEIEALKNAISDEVIDAAIMYADLSGFGSHYSEGLSDGFEQARAILRKASEK